MKFFKSLTTGLVLAGSLVLPAAGLAQGVNFDGLMHFPVGQAQLELAKDGSSLLVSNLTPDGKSGFATKLDSAVHWDASILVNGAKPGTVKEIAAFADGFRTAGSRLERTTDGFELQGLFTGADGIQSLYAVHVLQAGEVVAIFGGQTSSSRVVLGPDDDPFPWPIPFPWPLPWPPFPDPWPWPDDDFDIRTMGNCSFGFSFANNVTVTTDGGTAIGDRIELVENLPAGGHSLYLEFDAIRVRSTADSLIVVDENQISNGF